MCQLLVGCSVTLGALVAGVRGDATVGGGEADPVLDGVGGVDGAEAEHPAETTRVTTASMLPSPRPKLTPDTLNHRPSYSAAHTTHRSWRRPGPGPGYWLWHTPAASDVLSDKSTRL
jgi:hypothetical protein